MLLLQLQTHPFEKLFHHSPNYAKLWIFGCLCFPCLKVYTQLKLEPKSKPCIFLGYFSIQSAYKCLDPTTNKFFCLSMLCLLRIFFSSQQLFFSHSHVTSIYVSTLVASLSIFTPPTNPHFIVPTSQSLMPSAPPPSLSIHHALDSPSWTKSLTISLMAGEASIST